LTQAFNGLIPLTTYQISARFKGRQIGPAWIGAGWGSRGFFWLGDVDDWQEVAVVFTTEAGQTSLDLNIAVDGRTQALWVDRVRVTALASEQLDRAEAALRRTIKDGERQVAMTVVNAPLARALRVNWGAAQQELERLNTRRAALNQKPASMPQAEQAQWESRLLNWRIQADGVVCWTQDPMMDLKPTSLPPTLASLESLSWTACQNEHAPVVLNLTNLIGAPVLDVRVVLTPFVRRGVPVVPHRLGDWNPDECGATRAYRGTPEQIPAAQVVLREAVPIRKASGDWTMDPLSRLDQANRMVIPAGQTRQLWIDPSTFEVTPGVYQAVLELTPTDPLGNQAVRKIRLELDVLPVALPKRAPIAVSNFDYGLSANPNCRADLLEHRVNVFHVPCFREIETNPLPEQFKFLDAYMALAKQHDGLLVIENATVAQTGWKPEYAAWYRAMFKYLRAGGLRDDQFVMHLYDEQLSPEFLAAAKALKAIDKNVLIFADPFQTHYDAKTCSAFMPYIDIWCPKIGLLEHWFKEKPEIIDQIRAQRKQLWFYDCNSGKSLETAMSNRVFGWAAFKYNVQGCSAWTYATTDYGNPWGANNSSEKVYPLADGSAMPSRRWEAWREGIEDYCMLLALQQMMAAKGNRQLPESEYVQAEKTLRTAVAAVLNNTQDSAVLSAQRANILAALKRLSAPR
jgi:hypothetical protein